MEKVNLIHTPMIILLIPQNESEIYWSIQGDGILSLDHGISVLAHECHKNHIYWHQFKHHLWISPYYYIETIPKADNFDEIWKLCIGT